MVVRRWRPDAHPRESSSSIPCCLYIGNLAVNVPLSLKSEIDELRLHPGGCCWRHKDGGWLWRVLSGASVGTNDS